MRDSSPIIPRCPICSNLEPDFLSALPVGQRAIQFVSIAGLISPPSGSSCDECSLIWRILSYYKTTWDERDKTQAAELRIALRKPLQLFWRRDGIYLEVFSRKDIGVEGEGNLPEPTISKSIGCANEVSIESSSDACFRLASSWLLDCVQSHPTCQLPFLLTMPTRVIDVGEEGQREPFLVESNGKTGQYVALSYCWGNPKFNDVFKTTTQNYDKHKCCIEFEFLPRTLQDAITITRRLGLKYLWVDALCIIQGDPADWVRESAMMCDVYSNAHLTIAADNSSGTSQGIFNKQTFGNSPYKVPYKTGKNIYVRDELARQHDAYTLINRTSENPEPINCRAWTLQEAMLSNRMLRYTSKELVWECNTWRQCECGHGSNAIEPDDRASNRALRKSELSGQLSFDQLHPKWDQVIQMFTERQIGYDEDKLPALSGLANQFSTVFSHISASDQKDEYLAGMWRSNLVQSLLWGVEDDFYRDKRDKDIVYRRPKAWRAPSWSWAAVEGPVIIAPLRRFNSCIDIIEASTVPSTLDPYGRVKSGKLILIGRVIHGCTIEVTEPRIGDGFAGFTGGVRHIARNGDTRHVFLADESGIDLNIPVSCLLVGKVDIPGAIVAHEEFFLVLRRVREVFPEGKSRTDLCTFERIGVSFRMKQSGSGVGGSLFDTAAEETVLIV